METVTIKHLTHCLKKVKEDKNKGVIFFFGAGVSKTAGIPLAKIMATEIAEKEKDNEMIQKFSDEQKQSYSDVMGVFSAAERKEVLTEYIERSKVNIFHLYLAGLMAKDFVDYAFTVNFDNLMLRALSLFNQFPPTHDMAILKEIPTSNTKKICRVFTWSLSRFTTIKCTKGNGGNKGNGSSYF